MKRIIHKTALHCVGWTCIILGIIGLILPFMPGWVFFALGVYFLSLTWLWLWLKIEDVKIKFPRVAFHYERIDKKIGKYIKKSH